MTGRFPTALVVLTAMASTGAVALADPNLPDIPKHRHFVQTDNGLVQTGPRVCDNPRVQQAFNQYHSNNHVPVAGSPGPDGGNPGLHNGQGGEIVPRPCSFRAP